MAIDEAILSSVAEGREMPTLRFYGWKPPGISIGYFQKAVDEIDIESCRKAGIGVVRRLTGGRAVLHDEELTYSIIVPENYQDMPAAVNESYMYLSRGILDGLKSLGIPAKMTAADRTAGRKLTSAACFDAPSWYEITVQGKKVVGSAQTRQRGTILQHGSIVLRLDADRLVSALKFKSEGARDAMKRMLLKKAGGINEFGTGRIPLGDLKEAVLNGFERCLGVEFIEERLSDAEKEKAQILAASKYGTDGWNFGK